MNPVTFLTYYRDLNSVKDVEAEAKRLLEDSDLFSLAVPVVRRRNKDGKPLPYREIPSLRNASGLPHALEFGVNPIRREEYIAMQLFDRGYIDGLGYVLDYQTPIGGNLEQLFDDEEFARKVEGFKPGKIDLVVYDEKSNVLRLLELKIPESRESLLRAAMEAYTYLQILDKAAFVKNMRAVCAARDLDLPLDVRVEACPIVFEGSVQHAQYESGQYPHLRKLVDRLGAAPMLLSTVPSGKGVYVKGLKTWARLGGELCGLAKRQLVAVRPNVEFENEDEGGNSYYVTELDHNLIYPMDSVHKKQYGEGSGSELDWKMRAVRSSSAMTFNLLGNRRCELTSCHLGLSQGWYDISYEAQFAVLKHSASLAKANLDALLVHEGGKDAIACEMKMMEWAQKPAKAPDSKAILRGAYLHPESYDCANEADAVLLTGIADLLCSRFRDSRYDAAQMFRHTVSLLNAVEHGEARLAGIERLTLLNCVWQPQHTEGLVCEDELLGYLEEEHDGFFRFVEAMNPVVGLFARHDVEFGFAYCSPQELLDWMEKEASEREYLRRYE